MITIYNNLDIIYMLSIKNQSHMYERVYIPPIRPKESALTSINETK
jgi:hypothetical protein